MAPLMLGVALAVAGPAHVDPIARWRPLIEHASQRCGVPMSWITRVMRAESGGRTTLAGRPIRSRKGAIGLMQVMPGTWDMLRQRLGLGADPDDPRDNILAGACYLRLMHDRFGYPGLFAAYNAGPGRFAAVLAGAARLPRETIAYVGRVGGGLATASAITQPGTKTLLFVVRREAALKPSAPLEPTSASTLFAVRKYAE